MLAFAQHQRLTIDAMLQGRVNTSSRVLSSLPSSQSSIGPARGVLACNHRAQQRYGSGACRTAPLTGWQALQSLRPDLRQRHAVVVASSKGGDSSSSGGTQSSKQQEQDEEPAAEEEEEGETFTRYCFEGLLSSALIVGAGNLLGGSGAWSWDAPADGLNTILTCALVPTLMLLAICLPTYPAGQAVSGRRDKWVMLLLPACMGGEVPWFCFSVLNIVVKEHGLVLTLSRTFWCNCLSLPGHALLPSCTLFGCLVSPKHHRPDTLKAVTCLSNPAAIHSCYATSPVKSTAFTPAILPSWLQHKLLVRYITMLPCPLARCLLVDG